MKDQQKIKRLNLETVMSERFSRYSKSIIQQRALPDVRDGLKPVQRRILYAMSKDGNTYDKAFRKSAKAVGNVMGNFHPHGDSSIYEALIHMSQSWKMREPLIELHGNNGSMDGDPAAAMRYTEARTSKIAGEMLRDINKGTVSWVLNFDDTEYEPTVLPARFPNLLVNGSTGISSGYATQIPPHNLGEVIDAVIYLQAHPQATLDDLMRFIKGPDFPTGGIVQGLAEIKKAYLTGRGRIMIQSRCQIKTMRGGRKYIKVTEIPFGVNKLQMVKQIEAIRLTKKISGIAEVRDETDRSGLSIVIELKRNADAQGILNYLFKNTDLRIAYHFNVVAIDHQQPKRLPLKSILMSYLEYQRQVIKRRTQFNLNQAKKRKEIIDGLIKAMSILNSVIKVIRNSRNRNNAQNNLVKRFDFSTRQAQSIVALQLYRLTNTDVTALKREHRSLDLKINGLDQILEHRDQLDRVLKNELQAIKHEYATPRRTTIEAHIQSLKISQKVTVPDETVMVLVSHDGYLKRSSLRSYKASQANENGLKPGDYPLFERQLNTRDHLMMFTNKGRLIYRPVNEIDNKRWKDTGEHISQTIGLDRDERIIAVRPFKTLKPGGMFLVTTNDNHIKRSTFAALKPGRNYYRHASKFVNLKAKDSRVISVIYLRDDLPKCTVMLISKFGYADRFDLAEVSISGRNSAGVKAMNLKPHDSIRVVQLVNDDDTLAIATQRGSFKLQPVGDVPVTSRARRGSRILRHLKHAQYRITCGIRLDPNHDRGLKIYTDFRHRHEIIPSNYPISSLTSNGQSIINVQRDGEPVLMMY